MKNNGETEVNNKNTDESIWNFDFEWPEVGIKWDLNIEWTEFDYDWGTDDELLEIKNNSEENVKGADNLK